MAAVFEGKAIVTIVMGNIAFIVHNQKIKERYFARLSFVFSVMLNEQRQAQHFPEFGKRNKIKKKQTDCSKSYHEGVKGNYSLDNEKTDLIPSQYNLDSFHIRTN